MNFMDDHVCSEGIEPSGRGTADRHWNMTSEDLGPISLVLAARLRSQEFKNSPVRGFRLIGRKQMAGAIEQHELCARNARRDQFPVARRDQPIGLSVND